MRHYLPPKVGAKPEKMQTSKLLDSIDDAPPLSLNVDDGDTPPAVPRARSPAHYG